MAASVLEELSTVAAEGEPSLIAAEDPGAAPFGNFPHYYRFHPPKERVQLLSSELRSRLMDTKGSGPLLGLDVGCNSGDLSVALYRLLKGLREEDLVPTQSLEDNRPVHLLCCDIDATLVQRAVESNPFPNSITYLCLDIMDPSARQDMLQSFFDRFGCSSFDVVFCMSVTMWIHLNYGDSGLVDFLVFMASACKYLLVEPQPWKCYRAAARRLRKLGRNNFDHFRSLSITGDMTKRITDILVNEGNSELICSFGNTSWDRNILLFKSNRL
ncbi:RNA 5'-monophosphate methyltransferase [Ambystoma mexicanum]|uniref:RNA 5'-monophosphate methyltransferase n=1 Tax=Ambystoma mexicanum TaxID=8296 RepID=UPI0037E999E6